MKEFVEKLIGRLEELKSNPNEKTCRENILLAMQKNLTIYSAIEIVNQLAEEYEKKKILCEITLNGCDDDTCFDFKMTEQEYEFIKKVSEKANETSAYTCMPRMYVEKLGLFQKEGKKNWKI